MTRLDWWFKAVIVLFTASVVAAHGQTNPVTTVEFSHVTFTARSAYPLPYEHRSAAGHAARQIETRGGHFGRNLWQTPGNQSFNLQVKDRFEKEAIKFKAD